MRIPHTISRHIMKVYEPSEYTLKAISEEGRSVFAENMTWDDELGPTLLDMCVEAMVEDYKKHPDWMEYLILQDRILFLETLKTDLPLTLTIPRIQDDFYWKRCVMDKWEKVLDRRQMDGLWKKYYVERHLKEYLEEIPPEYNNPETMEEDCTLLAPYVFNLELEELRTCGPPRPPEDDPDKPMLWGTDHVPLEFALKPLRNLETLRIKFDVKNIAENFDFHFFELSVADMESLARGIAYLPHLRVLAIQRSALRDDQLQPLVQQLCKQTSIREVDFSYCKLGDRGGLMLGKLLSVHPYLEILRVPGNNIGDLGAHGIGYGLRLDGSCPLDILDLRLNPIGEDGMWKLCCGLVRIKKPLYLGVGGCGVRYGGAIRLAEMIGIQCSLQDIDISSNELPIEGCVYLMSSMEKNKTVTNIDLRNTGPNLSEDDHEYIQSYALRNKKHGPQLLSVCKLPSEEDVHRVFSFPVTDSEVQRQDAKDAKYKADLVVIKAPEDYYEGEGYEEGDFEFEGDEELLTMVDLEVPEVKASTDGKKGKSISEKTAAAKPDKKAAGSRTSGDRATIKPAADKSKSIKPAADKSQSIKPAADKSQSIKPASGKKSIAPAANRTSATTAAARTSVKPASVKSAAGRASVKPATVKFAADRTSVKPDAERASVKPAADRKSVKSAVDKSPSIKPAEDGTQSIDPEENIEES